MRLNSSIVWSAATALLLPASAYAESACNAFDTAAFWANATTDEVLECLESGADPSAEIRDGALDAWLPVEVPEVGQGNEAQSAPWKALHLAIAYGKSPDVIRAMIESGADPAATIAPGLDWTSLHVASAASGDPGIIDVLLQHGADPNAVTNGNGWTPMHVLAQWGKNPASGDILLDSGFDPTIRDEKGMTAWDLVQARFTEEERENFPPDVLAVFDRLALVSPPAGDIPRAHVSLPAGTGQEENAEPASTPAGDFLDNIDVRAIFRDPEYRPGALIRYPGGKTRILRAGEDIGEGWILAGALGNSIYVRRGNVRREIPLRD